MELASATNLPSIVYRGEQSQEVTNPSALKVQMTGPSASTWLDAKCPKGKKWNVQVWVSITETEEE